MQDARYLHTDEDDNIVKQSSTRERRDASPVLTDDLTEIDSSTTTVQDAPGEPMAMAADAKDRSATGNAINNNFIGSLPRPLNEDPKFAKKNLGICPWKIDRKNKPNPFADKNLLKRFPRISEKNRFLVAKNIRHFSNVFWLLLFSNWMLAICFGSIAYKIVWASRKSFSITCTLSYIPPAVLIEIVLIIIFTGVAYTRVLNFRCTKREKLYRTYCVFFIVHYLAMFLAISLKLYFDLSQLRSTMEKDLQASINEEITNIFDSTQIQGECCGINSFNDWSNESQSSDSVYPASCCPSNDSERDEQLCLLQDAWKEGCYSIEYMWLCWHGGWCMLILGFGFVVDVATIIQINRLHKYLLIFRPLSVI